MQLSTYLNVSSGFARGIVLIKMRDCSRASPQMHDGPVLAHIFRIIESSGYNDPTLIWIFYAKCFFEKYNAALYPSRFTRTISACATLWAKKVVLALKVHERSASRKWLGAERVLRLILPIKRLIELISNLGEINGIEIDKCQVRISGILYTYKRNIYRSLFGILFSRNRLLTTKNTSFYESIFAKSFRICQSHLCFIANNLSEIDSTYIVVFFYLFKCIWQLLVINFTIELVIRVL